MDDGPPKTSWKHDRPFRVGDLEIHPASGEIRGWDGARRVRPLLMDLLLRLAAAPGDVVRRETLLDEVWPRRMVNDEVLSRAMAELRSALGDDVKNARYVETLPKLGYRLVAPVGTLDVAAVAAPPPAKRARRGLVIGGAVAAVVAIGLAITFLRPRAGPPSLEAQLAAARPLTSDPGLELGPRFSPDGRSVAYAQTLPGGSRIVVRDLDGTLRASIGGADGTTRLSPAFIDGERIAFWWGAGERCGIVEWRIGQDATRELLDCGARPRSRIDVSADGRWLAFSAAAREQFPAGLHLLDLQGGSRRVLTAPEPGSGDDLFPRFAADATTVAFFRGNESHRSLWAVAREDAASARRLVKVDGLSYGAAWLDAHRLLVAADWFGFRALNTVDVRTGEARLAGARGARFPDVARDGAIVYESAAYAANLWRLPLDAREARALWTSTRYTNQPEYSPDGSQLAFSSNRDGTDAIHVAALDGTPRRIAGDERRRFLRPHWSANGAYVHAVRVTVQEDGATLQEAVRIATDGGTLEVLGALGTAVADVRETRDGRSLLWAENTGHAMRLLRAPPGDPSKAERLPWPLASHFQVNGERVVLAQPQLARLTSCRLSDLSCEPLDVDVAPADLYHWSLGEKSLFLRTREGLARYDLGSRKVVATLPAVPSGGGTSVAVSRDEREITFVREEGPAIDLVLARPR